MENNETLNSLIENKITLANFCSKHKMSYEFVHRLVNEAGIKKTDYQNQVFVFEKDVLDEIQKAQEKEQIKKQQKKETDKQKRLLNKIHIQLAKVTVAQLGGRLLKVPLEVLNSSEFKQSGLSAIIEWDPGISSFVLKDKKTEFEKLNSDIKFVSKELLDEFNNEENLL